MTEEANAAQTDTDAVDDTQVTTDADSQQSDADDKATGNDDQQQQQQDGGDNTDQSDTGQDGGDGGSDTDDDADDQGGAPEEYSEFTLPEGMDIDQETLDQAKEHFKEMNLSQDQAQKLVELQANAIEKIGQQQSEAFQKQVDDWLKEVEDDAEYGGEKLDATKQDVGRVMDEFGDDEVRTFFDESGLGNHPGLVKMFARIGKAMGEDNGVSGGNPSTGPLPDTKVFYDKT